MHATPRTPVTSETSSLEFVSYTLDLQEHFLQKYDFKGAISFMIVT